MIAFPSPRANPYLIGHDRAERVLREVAGSDRFSHAWLITGLEGIGKATLAHRLGRALLAGFPRSGLQVPEDHDVFRQYAAGAHPDLLEVGATSEPVVTVDEIRQVAQMLGKTAIGGGWRVVLMDGVHRLNGNAANALLKLLEEPPKRVAFLLVTPSPDSLTSTLRSRCVQVRLRRLSEADVQRALEPFADRFGQLSVDQAIRSSGGSVGKAIERLKQDEGSDREPAETSGPVPFVGLENYRHRVISLASERRFVEQPEDAREFVERWSKALSLIDAKSKSNLDERHLLVETERGLHP